MGSAEKKESGAFDDPVRNINIQRFHKQRNSDMLRRDEREKRKGSGGLKRSDTERNVEVDNICYN